MGTCVPGSHQVGHAEKTSVFEVPVRFEWEGSRDPGNDKHSMVFWLGTLCFYGFFTSFHGYSHVIPAAAETGRLTMGIFPSLSARLTKSILDTLPKDPPSQVLRRSPGFFFVRKPSPSLMSPFNTVGKIFVHLNFF